MSYNTTTLQMLRTRVQERLLSTFWSATELNLYIIEALRVWNVLTGYNRTIDSISTTGGMTSYNIPTTINANTMMVQRIELNNVTISGITGNVNAILTRGFTFTPTLVTTDGFGSQAITSATHIHMDPLTLQSVGAMIPAWHATPSGIPTMWFQVGMNQFVLYPKLSTTTVLDYYSLGLAPIPSSDIDLIQIGEEDMPAIIDYAVFVARLKESGSEFKESITLLKNVLMQASKYNAKILQSAIYKRIIGIPYQQQQRPSSLEHQIVK